MSKTKIIITVLAFTLTSFTSYQPQTPHEGYRLTALKLATALPVPITQPLPELQPVYVPPTDYSQVVGQNTYRDYIFTVESGYRLDAVNSIGCIGLGQDCNGWLITGRLDSPVCPDWATDLPCQLNYWDWYANVIYGGWANAYAFRSTHNWW